MAIGPLVRIFAQAAILGISIIARALPAAYAQALSKARKDGVKATSDVLKNGLRKSEALEILQLTETTATPEAIAKQYDRYFKANAVEKGGSFYIQSKIYRAKELLDEFVKEKEKEKKEEEQTEKERKTSK